MKTRRPVVAMGFQAANGTIVVTDVLCANFPDTTAAEIADLSWKLTQWADTVRRYAPPPPKAEAVSDENQTLAQRTDHEDSWE